MVQQESLIVNISKDGNDNEKPEMLRLTPSDKEWMFETVKNIVETKLNGSISIDFEKQECRFTVKVAETYNSNT